jgi:hypothetical protein
MEPGWPHDDRPSARRMWVVQKDSYVMECEVNRHPLGHELRVYLRKDLHYSRVHRSLDDAEAEAEERKGEMLTRGWKDVRSVEKA